MNPVELQIIALKDQDVVLRVKAAKVLGEMRESRAFEPLIAALKDENADVRALSAWALGNMGNAKAIGPLEDLLKEANDLVRGMAGGALSKLRYPQFASNSSLNIENIWIKMIFDRNVPQQLTEPQVYNVSCMPFGCPHCGCRIVKVPSWPARGNSVAFYAQIDINQSAAYHIELCCSKCSEMIYVVWDDDPT
jgi:hypothetical protein